MSGVDWADEEVSDDEKNYVAPEVALEDKLLSAKDRERDRRAPAPKERRELRGPESGGRGGGGGGGGRGGDDRGGRGGQYPNRDRRTNDNYEQGDRRGDRGDRADRPVRPPRQPVNEADVPTTGPFIAYCGNLSFKVSPQDLGEYLVGGGCDVTDVVLAEDETGRKRGFGHVTFANRDSLLKALFEANGTSLDGRDLLVDINKQEQNSNRDRGGGGRFGGGRGGGGEGRGDGDRRSYADSAPRGPADTEDTWARSAKPAVPARRAERGDRDRGDGPERAGRGDGGRGGGLDRERKAPAQRPTLNLAPRTVPIADVAAPVEAVSSIFGDAKPRDAKLFTEPEAKKAFPRRESSGADKPKGDRKERKEGDSAASGDAAKKAPAAPVDLTPIVRGQVPPELEKKPRERKEKTAGAGADGAFTEKRNGKERSNSSVSANSGGAAPSGKKEGSRAATGDSKNKKATGTTATAAAAAKPKAPKPTDGLTDEERFNAAQAALLRTSLAPADAGAAKKSKNVFAAFNDGDSDSD